MIREKALAENKIQWVNPSTDKGNMGVGYFFVDGSPKWTPLVKLRDQESSWRLL
jgi:hypothetical protein